MLFRKKCEHLVGPLMESRLACVTQKAVTQESGAKVRYISDPRIALDERIDPKPIQRYVYPIMPMLLGGCFIGREGTQRPHCCCVKEMRRVLSNYSRYRFVGWSAWVCNSRTTGYYIYPCTMGGCHRLLRGASFLHCFYSASLLLYRHARATWAPMDL